MTSRMSAPFFPARVEGGTSISSTPKSCKRRVASRNREQSQYARLDNPVPFASSRSIAGCRSNVAGMIPVLVTRFSKSMNRATRRSFSLTMPFCTTSESASPDLPRRISTRRVAVRPKSSDTARMPAPPSVLVVDDHEDTRELYMTCLSLGGFDVRGAADGAEGLAQVRKHRPDLVLLDFALPRMNGAEVLREIRGDPELSRTPVVLVSAQMRLCLAEVEGLTFQAALEKPCDLDEVLGAVRSAIAA